MEETQRKDPYAGRKGVLKKYLETTTIKGVPKFMKSTSVILKLMWFLVVIIGLSISIYMLILLLTEYLSHSTVTSVEEYKETNKDESFMPFPDITICNLHTVNTHPDDYPAYLQYLQDMRKLIKKTANTFDQRYHNSDRTTRMAFNHLFDGYGFFQNYPLKHEQDRERVNNLFLSCMAAGWTWSNCAEEHHIAVSIFPGLMGPCFTVNMTAVSLGGQRWVKGITAVLHLDERENFTTERLHYEPSLRETHASGIVLMVHAQNTAPNTVDYVNLSPGTHSTVHIEPVIKKRLPEPYSNCAEENRLKQNPYYKGYLDENIRYSGTHCEEICFQIQLIEECGCMAADAYHTRTMYEKFPYCGNIEKYNDGFKLLDTINCTQYFMYGKFDRSKCSCRQPCTETEYYLKTSSTPWPHPTYEGVFLQTFVRTSETFQQAEKYEKIYMNIDHAQSRSTISKNFMQVHVIFERSRLIKFIDKAAIDFTTMVGSLGGILNLWIGISFVTIFELVEVFYLLCRKVSH